MRAQRSFFALLGNLALLPALAGAQHVGSEFQVNTYTTDDQRTLSAPRDAPGGLVAADASGNFVVVWYGSGEGYGSGIFGQRYDSEGVAVGEEFRVNSHTSGGSRPSVAMAAEGDFVVVWMGQDGSNAGVVGQRYDSEGAPQGVEFRVNSYTTLGQGNPFVASDASGNFVVVWTSDRQYEDSWGIFGQRYDSGGAAQGSEFRVNSYTPEAQHEPSVAMAATGDFVVVWASRDQDGDFYGVFGQRYDSAGVAQGGEFRVNSYTTGSQDLASVASDASGNFVVVWHGPGQSEGYGIFGQRYDSSGKALGGEFHVNSYIAGVQIFPSVASDAGGNFSVVWQGSGLGDALGIFAQRYDSDGVPQGGEFRVSTYTTLHQQFSSVAATGVREFVVAWESNGQDGSGFGVFGQRIDSGGDQIPPSVTVTAPNGGERLFTGLSYPLQWTASDETALSSFDVLVSADGGGTFAPIADCQGLPGAARRCLWLAPGPPSATALVRVRAQDTSGNSALDDSDAVFSIVSGTGSVTVETPNSDVNWQVGSLQGIEWTHNLGLKSTFRIELDRDDDGSYEELIATAAPADGARSGSFAWTVTGPPSAICRVRASWTANLAVTDSSDVTFQITLDPSEFQINTYTTDDQQPSSIGSDGNGNFVVVWTSSGQDGSGGGVFGQRYDSAGEALGGEFRVNSYTTSSQGGASVASDAMGNFVVVWSGGGLGDVSGIFGQRYDSTGDPQGTEFRVNSYTTNSQSSASVASDASGNFVVVWRSRGGPGGDADDVFGRRYDRTGEPLGTEFRVNSYTTAYQTQGSVASDASGNFVVVWSSSTTNVKLGVFGQRYDSDGTAQGSEFLVDSPGRSGGPSVATDATGDFVVVWHNQGPYGGDDVYGRRFDRTGVPQGPTFRVNSFIAGYQQDPSLASDASGNFVVAWNSRDQDGNYDGIFGQRYDSAGVAQGDEFQINAHTTGQQQSPSVGASGTNQFVVAWTSDDQDGDAAGGFGRRFDFGSANTITVESPNTNVKWRIGSVQRIKWTHSLGLGKTFRIKLDRDDDGDYEELIAAAAPADSDTNGHFAWTVTGPVSGSARMRVSWTDDLSVSDVSDMTFQIRPAALDSER
jgi:hypothetical protein